jgi:membrane fusion protein (multidrug efflux system)
MLATVKVKLGERAGLIAAPKKAIVHLADGPAVFVVRDGKAVRVRPDLTVVDKDHVFLPAGARVGDQVVVSGQDGLKDGAAVKVVDKTAKAGNAAPTVPATPSSAAPAPAPKEVTP